VSTPNTRDCAALVSNTVPDRAQAAHYRDLSCIESVKDFKVAPICQYAGLEQPSTSTAPPTSTAPAECPNGWIGYNTDYGVRKCYQICGDNHYATTAETSCNGLGGNLVSVHSMAEQSFLASILYPIVGSYPFVWIGGVDTNHDRVWEWTDGSSFDFDFWLSGQPDGQYHVMMDFNEDSKGKWRDIDLDNDFHYVCQIVL
jgi:hypothetical protein